jgi:hypothetical protein
MENGKGRVKKLLKELFGSKLGWLAIILANVIWSTFWFIPLAIGFITGNQELYVISGGIYLFFLQPLIPMWLIIPVTAYPIMKYLKTKVFKENK